MNKETQYTGKGIHRKTDTAFDKRTESDSFKFEHFRCLNGTLSFEIGFISREKSKSKQS